MKNLFVLYIANVNILFQNVQLLLFWLTSDVKGT